MSDQTFGKAAREEWDRLERHARRQYCPRCDEIMEPMLDDDPLCRHCMLAIEVEQAEAQFEARFRGADDPVGTGPCEFDAIDSLIRAI